MRIRSHFQGATTTQITAPETLLYATERQPKEYVYIGADITPSLTNYASAIPRGLNTSSTTWATPRVFANTEVPYLKSTALVLVFSAEDPPELLPSGPSVNNEFDICLPRTRLKANPASCSSHKDDINSCKQCSKVEQSCDASKSQVQNDRTTPESILTPQSVFTPEYSLSPSSPTLASAVSPCCQPGAYDRKSKPKIYSPAEWESIKPKFVRLYLEEDMKLWKVMQKLRDEDNFYATEPMYKRKIKAWGLRKIMTAKEKDEAIQVFSKGRCPTWKNRRDGTSRVYRTRRHAAFRVKQGTLARQDQELVIQQSKCSEAHDMLDRVSDCHKEGSNISGADETTEDCSMFHLQPPNDFIYLDQLFPALSALATMCNKALPSTVHEQEDRLSSTLDKGLVSWKLNAFGKASEFFNQASHIMYNWLQQDTIPMHTMLYYILPEAWAGCMPVFGEFIRYAAKMVQQELRSTNRATHPLCQVAQLLHENPQSSERGFAVWKCMHDHIRLLDHTSTHWADTIMYRVRFCKRNTSPHLAITICRNAIATLKRAHLLTDQQHIDFAIEIAENYYRLSDWPKTERAYLKTIDLAMSNLDAFVEYKILALESLAEIQANIHQDLTQARRLYVEALNISIAFMGRDHPDSLHLLRELLRLCERKRCELEQSMPTEEFLETYHCLEQVTAGDWRFRLDCDGNVVERMASEVCGRESFEYDPAWNLRGLDFNHVPAMRSFKIMCGPLQTHSSPL